MVRAFVSVSKLERERLGAPRRRQTEGRCVPSGAVRPARIGGRRPFGLEPSVRYGRDVRVPKEGAQPGSGFICRRKRRSSRGFQPSSENAMTEVSVRIIPASDSCGAECRPGPADCRRP